MEAISRDDLRAQAMVFAREMVALLERENAQSSHSPEPLRAPDQLLGTLQIVYTRFVSRHRMVAP